MNREVAVVGAGVVGSAIALALARRGVEVVLLEAEAEPGLCASGTNSGILHAGFDSVPGEIETELLLRAAALRDPVLDALGVPVERCGAVMRPRDPAEEVAIARLAENAARNGVEAELGEDGSLSVPGEAITDPLAYTQALAAAAQRHGAELRTGFRVTTVERASGGIALGDAGGERVEARVVVNAAGLGADGVAGAAGQDDFEIYPRKGEFLVFDPPRGERLERILLPVPEEGTKGVIVFPTVDGKVISGPTAVDGTDKSDWSVRPGAREEILRKAAPMWEPLADAEPIATYAGLRTAGRERAVAGASPGGAPGPSRPLNYLIGPSAACEDLLNVAAIRSTGMTASLGIAERVVQEVADLGVEFGREAPLEPAPAREPGEPWWRRAANRSGSAGTAAGETG
jgi:glycerol-3-phosphate dehydrogenase